MTHICLYDEASKIMLTGDHVLERITPNISSFMLETDELGDFLASLRKVRDYDVKLALPGHGEPFSGLARRVDELIAHHEARLTEMEDLVSAVRSAVTDVFLSVEACASVAAVACFYNYPRLINKLHFICSPCGIYIIPSVCIYRISVFAQSKRVCREISANGVQLTISPQVCIA